MKTSQSGFTLIELIVVIVILGIVGAVATARFQDISSDALSATQSAIAGEIQSSSAINYAEGVLDGSYTNPVTAAQTCAVAAASLLTSGAIPSGWTVNAAAIAGCGAAGNTTTNCTIVDNPVTLGAMSLAMICTG